MERTRVTFTIFVVGTVEPEISEDELAELGRSLAEAAERRATMIIAASSAQVEWELGS
jgi:hypothetical protein